MKIHILAPLLVLFSCGQYTADTEVGQLKSTAPVLVDGTQKQQLAAVCDAIAQKTSSASSLVGTQSVFDYSIKGCTETKLGTVVTVPTTIQSGGDGYKFTLPGGSYFYFADIETTDKGSLSKVCAQLAGEDSFASPIKAGNEYIYFTTISINPSDCDAQPDQTCVYLEKGSEGTTAGQASIHTKEWIRIDRDTRQGRLGFFTLKKELTSKGCAEFQDQIHLAKLK